MDALNGRLEKCIAPLVVRVRSGTEVNLRVESVVAAVRIFEKVIAQ